MERCRIQPHLKIRTIPLIHPRYRPYQPISYHATHAWYTRRIVEAVVSSDRILRITDLHGFYSRSTTPRVQREAERDLRV